MCPGTYHGLGSVFNKFEGSHSMKLVPYVVLVNANCSVFLGPCALNAS